MLKKVDPAFSTLLAGGAIAVVLGLGVAAISSRTTSSISGVAGSAHADTAQPAAQWAASATGRVEPKDGEIRIATQVAGPIAEVLAKTNDQVKAGDLLMRLDDADYYTKITAAKADVGVREREREDEKVDGLAKERRDAEDALAAAQREVFAAHESFDAALRAQKADNGDDSKVDEARRTLQSREDAVAKARATLRDVNAKPGMPLPQRLEASLTASRADLTSAELALERTRVRAPADGTVLNMLGRIGETAVPSPDSAVVIFGDLSGLRLRAEVEERDAAKVHVGQGVVVKADAFPDKTFEGTVTSISQSLGPPRIASRGPRRPNDVEVVEVMVALDGHPPLFTGMRVDAFFKNDNQASAASTPPTVSKTN